MTHHPMVPTNEQLKKWEDAFYEEGENFDVLLIEAYQAGADAELKACGEVVGCNYDVSADELQSARRPKPPSLANEALDALEKIDAFAIDQMSAYTIHDELTVHKDTIVRALQQLKQLEGEIK